LSTRHIGILAHSAEGSALCYLTATHEGARRLGAYDHPEITMSILPMGPVLPAWERLDLVEINRTLARSAGRLAAAGCDFFVCPDNTAHIALEAPGLVLPLPGLHIAEVVAATAAARGHRRIGLLGTKWTMEGRVYPDAFRRHGLECRVPEPEDRALIDRVIFAELCKGIFRDESRAGYVGIIAGLKAAGCDAVALCCTEIPLLVAPEQSPLPVLDSTRLLGLAAVETALGDRPMPVWRGGPLAD